MHIFRRRTSRGSTVMSTLSVTLLSRRIGRPWRAGRMLSPPLLTDGVHTCLAVLQWPTDRDVPADRASVVATTVRWTLVGFEGYLLNGVHVGQYTR